ncbi:flagellar motor switch protein FliM, partial [Salipiger sp. HF18]|nr:flagellar motor switch protein FliM [Salipiger sp. HF18]
MNGMRAVRLSWPQGAGNVSAPMREVSELEPGGMVELAAAAVSRPEPEPDPEPEFSASEMTEDLPDLPPMEFDTGDFSFDAEPAEAEAGDFDFDFSAAPLDVEES